MSFSSRLKLKSKFFDAEIRRQIFSAVPYAAARAFRSELQRKMTDSVPTGRIESVGRGTGFETRFQRSRRGQRPAIQTRKLISSIYAYRQISASSASVEVTATDEKGENYGEVLQQKLGRLVMTDADRAESQQDFKRRASDALLDLLK